MYIYLGRFIIQERTLSLSLGEWGGGEPHLGANHLIIYPASGGILPGAVQSRLSALLRQLCRCGGRSVRGASQAGVVGAPFGAATHRVSWSSSAAAQSRNDWSHVNYCSPTYETETLSPSEPGSR